MKTIEISEQSYQKIQDLKRSFSNGNLLLPKIDMTDEDIIEVLTSDYNKFYILMVGLVGYELQDKNLKQNWCQTEKGLIRKKNLKKDYINVRKIEEK
jgi:hypothetical protein